MASSEDDAKDGDTEKKKKLVRNAVTLQRMRLERLMKHPEKPVIIPDRSKERKMPHVPDFVRNVMGSSAGAGSGEFHVYRHLRRKEYARQKIIQEKAVKACLDDKFQQKLLENQVRAEMKTAKKRAKRLKNKEKLKKKKCEKKLGGGNASSSDNRKESSDSDGDEEPKKNTDSGSDEPRRVGQNYGKIENECELKKTEIEIEGEANNKDLEKKGEVNEKPETVGESKSPAD